MQSLSARKLRILFLEDELNDFRLVARTLERGKLNCDLVRVESHRQFMDELATAPDIILSDHHLPEFDGFAALNIARTKCPDVPFIFVTGNAADKKTSEAAKHGVLEVVPK